MFPQRLFFTTESTENTENSGKPAKNRGQTNGIFCLSLLLPLPSFQWFLLSFSVSSVRSVVPLIFLRSSPFVTKRTPSVAAI